MQKKSHLEIARHQIAASGISIIDRDELYAACPTNWASSQEQVMVGNRVRDMAAALRVEYPACKWFECLLGGRAVLGLARTLEDIEKRVLYLTGKSVTGVKAVNDPLSNLAVETSRVKEIQAPEKVDDLAGFDLAEALASLPHHLCANRAAMLDKIEAYWLRNPEAYTRNRVYVPGETGRHTAIRSKLKQAHPELDFGPDESDVPAYNII